MISFFTERKEKFQKQAEANTRRYNQLSLVRVAIFILMITSLILLLSNGHLLYSFAVLVIYLIGFGMLVNHHRKIKKQERFYLNLARLNGSEISRLQLKLNEFDDGQRYLDEHHPYAFDLDIFGKHSLFQLLSRCSTVFGTDLLAKDLLVPQSTDLIKKRQEAIREIKDDIDWRQHIQSAGLIQQKLNNDDIDAFYRWLGNDQEIKHLKWLSRFAMVIWVLFALVFYFVLTNQILFYWLLAFNVVFLLILGPKLKIIKEVAEALTKIKDQLSVVNDIITLIEQKNYSSEYLQQLFSALREGKTPASRAIKELSSIVDFLNNRGNNLYLLANSFLLFDFVLLQKAEKWKGKYASHVKDWFTSIGQFEVMLSYAGFSFANEDYAFPTMENGFIVSGKEIGHPLIEKEKLIKNDFEIQGRGGISLITGSNMAGKSTFLRSMGINLVLAQVGAPVCASDFVYSPVKVFTSMRTKDNLEENISTFYAELLRINTLLKSIDENTPTFFLLDEILKGTNSFDRHKGAEALMKQLSLSNAFGLVSTHDVELNNLSEQMKNFSNYSFHSQMVEGNLKFDYKLRKGPCLDFNAIELMKKMGISVDD